MFFSNEMIEKARTASSTAELLEMAKANGVELSAEDAEMYFDFLTKKTDLFRTMSCYLEINENVYENKKF